MYITNTVELAGPPLEFWQRIGKDDGARLRTLARRVATEAGPFRTLLGFRQPNEEPRTLTFDCETPPQPGPGGSMFVVWEAGLARLEGLLEVVPAGQAHELRLIASYEPPWAATLIADRSVLRRIAEAGLGDFLLTVARSAPGSVDAGGPVRRRHVLIEDEDPAWQRVMAALADGEDCEFDGCRGPALVPGGCPVLRGDTCPKVDWADTVLHSLDDRRPDNAEVLDRLKQHWPGVSAMTVWGERPTHCLTRHPDLQPC